MNIKLNLSLEKLTIGQRLLTMTSVMATTLFITAGIAFFALSYASSSSQNLEQKVSETSQIGKLIDTVQNQFINTLNSLNTGVVTWNEANQKILSAQEEFEQSWKKLQAIENIDAIKNTVPNVQQAFNIFTTLGSNQSRASLELFLLNDLHPLIDPFLIATNQHAGNLAKLATDAFQTSESVLNTTMIIGILLILFGMTGAIALAHFVRKSIVEPVEVIAGTVTQIQKGETDARTLLAGQDELSQLGQALDQLLNERVATLISIEKENEALNDSIIELLEGTSRLSERDLTTRLSVREDVTGSVADALNVVTKETAEALAKIHQVSELVNTSSVTVDEQTQKVSQVAEQERELVEQTISKLDSVSKSMTQIAKLCQTCNSVAKSTANTTDKAFEAVEVTVESMEEIRDSISETEKRIKRLSERSQEISGIIDIINNIAERTHVLALNASMQAAAAGDAGRGFAVVADEVQRLAESSRNSTSQISGLIRNIQSETADAVDNMNTSINQVVSGSKRAVQAGTQMQETQNSTKQLVSAVEKIASKSLAQAKEAETLRSQANRIEKSTQITRQELERQSVHTERLRAASGVQKKTVELFQLPEIEAIDLELPELKTAIPDSISSAEPIIPSTIHKETYVPELQRTMEMANEET